MQQIEPVEDVTVDVDEAFSGDRGGSASNTRKGRMTDMRQAGGG